MYKISSLYHDLCFLFLFLFFFKSTQLSNQHGNTKSLNMEIQSPSVSLEEYLQIPLSVHI